MGTNFYFKPKNLQEIVKRQKDDGPFHIGKRSAAGKYCNKCNITLCKGGNDDVHSDSSEWYASCPKCGASEVDYALSFSWDMQPSDVRDRCNLAKDKLIITDEYGEEYTGNDFLSIIDKIQIQFTDSIGRQFC